MAEIGDLLKRQGRPLPAAFDRRLAELARLIDAQGAGRTRTSSSAGADLASFLLLFDACEVTAKLLQGARDGVSLTRALKPDHGVNLHKLRAACAEFSVATNYARLRRVFASDEVEAKRMSAKMLCQKAVLELSHDYIFEVNHRGPRLMDDMRGFLHDVRNRGQI
jgi:hypothetical protein